MLNFEYIWTWQTRLPHRRGQLFRVLHRGNLNSCLIEFQDGHRTVTSRNALRKHNPAATPARTRECTCTYQKERTWGYALYRWQDGRTPWKPLATILTAADAARFAAHKSLPHILIKCNGCGDDIIRLQPSR